KEYTRTAIDVGAPTRPFLYHPRSQNPRSYKPVDRSTLPASPPAPRTAPKPQIRTLGLEAADFLPIGRQELRESAQQVRTWGNPWFGRRDLLPPADDQRTLLIDRALVSNGLLSPEQLAEIHKVGAEMERHRTDLDAIQRQAIQQGEAAVRADKERRA